ncbi:hypothetical protein HFP51_00890 [Parasphingopyxis sp. CP4]|uniref:hypothetical protein n=1 Tax=Parasphingopyxis sp. CP4 TaxID=2724527 RepID=UPI0015A0CB6B|nr:hypothetical protein [Parasphingopyxis sp. CP4]QLC20866.1 hypothetical protein HFP51_00890 [Parasphingopyxis sp. CP4]
MRMILYSISAMAVSALPDAGLCQTDDNTIIVDIDQYPLAIPEDVTPGWIQRNGQRATVVYGEMVDVFEEDSGEFVPVGGATSSLRFVDGHYRYECCGGTVVVYDHNLSEGYAREDIVARATEVTLPDGVTMLFSYHTVTSDLPVENDQQDPSTVTLLLTLETTAPAGYERH